MGQFLYLLLGDAIGAIMSYSLPFLVGAPRYVWLSRKQRQVVEGVWHSYHYTRKSSKPELLHTRWIIRRTLRGQLLVSCWGDDSAPSYKRTSIQGRGNAFQEHGFLVMTVAAMKYRAQWSIRVRDPIPSNEKCVPGLWLSFDFDGKLIAGPIFFAREPITETEAATLIRSLIAVNPQYRQLGLERITRPSGVVV
jgi:hypothetical protein